jgi:uncharacterized caspase-like protein
MSRLVLSAVALALGLLPIWADPAFADRRVALLIGNSAYQNAPALPNPRRDAEAMAAMFLKAGFDVVNAQYDVGSLQFKQAIALFEDEAAHSDIAVVYYAGHGIEIQGINYLLPVNAKLVSDRDAENEAITLDRLAKSVDGAKRLRLVILDTCRDNPFAQTMTQQRTAAPQGVNPGLAAVHPSTDTLIAYSAKPNSEAADCYAEHSPFTAALLHNLFVPGLDIRFAFGRVFQEVRKKTGNRQEPFVYGKLRHLNIIALVPPLGRPAGDLGGEKLDYSIVEKLSREQAEQAWVVFLVQHPTGFYSDQARQQIGKLRVASAARLREASEEAAAQRAEAERQAKLEEVKRQADEAARERAEQEAALDRAREQAKAAEQARLNAEREAALKRDEELRQRQLSEVARAKEQADADAVRQKAEQDAALDHAREQAKAAEEARLNAEREAVRKRDEEARQAALVEATRAKEEAACKYEGDRLASLQAAGSKARDELKQFERGLTCERLRPLVTAALDRANTVPDVNKPEQVRAAQRELNRLGCFSGAEDGVLNGPTKTAVQLYEEARGAKPASDVEITDEFVSELKTLSARVCPLICAAGKVAEGEQCVVAEKSKPVARAKQEEKAAPRRETTPRVVQQAPGGGGGHGSVTIGIGF